MKNKELSECLAKQGISRHIKEFDNNDKNTFHLPRQVSFTINHTFAKWGKAGHKLPETLINTTVSTTKAHAEILGKAKRTATIR